MTRPSAGSVRADLGTLAGAGMALLAWDANGWDLVITR